MNFPIRSTYNTHAPTNSEDLMFSFRCTQTYCPEIEFFSVDSIPPAVLAREERRSGVLTNRSAKQTTRIVGVYKET